MPDSLITPEVRAAIGTVADERSGTVYQKEFQRFAAAVGDLNPLYFDKEAAAAAGYRDVIMPPTFLNCVLNGVTRLDALKDDGTTIRSNVDLPLPKRIMAAGEETVYHQVVYPGDRLTARSMLSDITEKHGRSGTFAVVTWVTEYRNQNGDLVANTTSSTIAR
jgi:acyl dehydratase